MKNKLLWQALTHTIACQNLGRTFSDIIPLNNNQLLVLYNVPEDIDLTNYVSKIRIWNMQKEAWADKDFMLPKVSVFGWAISKDLTIVYLWCNRNTIIAYDLVNLKELNTVILPHNIASICVFDENKICCGLTNGLVEIYEHNNTEPLFSFSTGSASIEYIDSVDSVVLTAHGQAITYAKIKKNDNGEYCISCALVESFDGKRVRNMQLGSDGKNVLINFSGLNEKVTFFRSETLLVLKELTFCPSFVGFKRTYDGEIIVVGEGKVSLLGRCNWDAFKSLLFLDARSGETIKRINFSNEKRLKECGDIWRGFALAPDSSYMIVYNNSGLIAKISLNLDVGLEQVLQQIKFYVEQEKTRSKLSDFKWRCFDAGNLCNC